MRETPPKLFLRLFRWYCHPKLVDHIEGDLIEVYQQRLQKIGKTKADIRFVIDVLLLFRPSIIKPVEGYKNLNNYGMMKSYFKTGWRNLLRNKVYSMINITGLAIGMAVVFLIYQYIQVELSYDQFHDKVGRIYRVPLSYVSNGKAIRASAGNDAALGPTLKSEFPEIEEFTRLAKSSLFVVGTNVSYNKSNSESVTFNEDRIFYADESFFNVFTFSFLEGDAGTSLKDPKSIVMTHSMALKYFGEESGLGKIVQINRVDYKVTGILKDIPENSHLQFDFLISFSSLAPQFGYDVWNWPEYYTYVLLTPASNPATLEKKFPAFMEKHLGRSWAAKNFKTAIDLQPITEIHLKSNLDREQSTNGSERMVFFIALLGIFILAIAWINYVNLSTAKSLERAKEIGLRKVSGATRTQLIAQFFLDAYIINLLAFVLAIIIVKAGTPIFEELIGKNVSSILSSSGKMYSISFWGWIGLTWLLGLLISGFYPALLFSSFKANLILKGEMSTSASRISLRKVLVGFQYVLSIFLIAGTLTISRQLSFLQHQDLGYNKDELLVVRGVVNFDSTYSNQLHFFQSEIKKIPAAEKLTFTADIPGHPSPYLEGIRPFNTDANETKYGFAVAVDDQFIPTYEMELLAGRNFSEDERFVFSTLPSSGLMTFRNSPGLSANPAAHNKVMINEKMVKILGYKTPEDAIHQAIKLRMWDEFTGEIIGVVKNYHQVSLHNNYDAMFYIYPAFDAWAYFSIRVDTKNLPETIDKIKNIYSKAFPGNPFEYFFLEDHFNQQYQNDRQLERIFNVLTILALLISCLGIIGLGIFSVSQRMKEIGIRKVLGASVAGILALFSKEIVRLVLISYIITLPIIWFAMRSWLSNFAFRIGMEWQIFLMPPLLLLIISLVTIIIISIRTALLNPIISLRNE